MKNKIYQGNCIDVLKTFSKLLPYQNHKLGEYNNESE